MDNNCAGNTSTVARGSSSKADELVNRSPFGSGQLLRADIERTGLHLVGVLKLEAASGDANVSPMSVKLPMVNGVSTSVGCRRHR